MSLPAGTRLGPYEVLSPLGAGGMGEVYRARDTRLNRTVAIKVLPSHFADQADVRQRFEREAHAISSLNHPHICALYDIGRQDGVDFLVLELLEGETLAARLEKGALPLDQSLRYAMQIADALDRAHRQGVVHRDLKPGNIMLTKDGAKLLDFGLAKLQNQPADDETVTKALTAQGTILGTFQYMAPEQLEGKDADTRTDIFAFGAVLYEMVTGRRAFAGKTQASVIAAILAADPPPVSTLQATSPPALDHLVRTCLVKDPDDRRQTIHDVKLELKWIAEGGGSHAKPPGPPSKHAWLPWILAVAILLAAPFVVVYFRRAPEETRTVRSFILPPQKTNFTGIGNLAVSPDGRRLAFVAVGSDGANLLWVRSLDSLSSQSLNGTDGALYPFWSPDSRFIAFVADGKLKKIEASGGPPITLCGGHNTSGGTWNRDGVILFGGLGGGPLYRVEAAGGEATTLTKLDQSRGETGQRFPSFLPDGRHFLYQSATGSSEQQGIYVGSLDSKEIKRLIWSEASAQYGQGNLLFVRNNTLMAQPLDLQRLETAAAAFPIAEDVAVGVTTGRAAFSVAENGVLVYQTGGMRGDMRLTWFNRSGKKTGVLGDRASYGSVSLSPDGAKAATNKTGAQAGVWLYDIARGLPTRLTFDAAFERYPVWSPDGSRIVFSSSKRNGHFELYEKAASGAGTEQLIAASDVETYATSWSPDGQFTLWFTQGEPPMKLGLLPVAGDRKPRVFLQAETALRHGQFSPDGRWIAYGSYESGKPEVYVAPFPGPGGKRQVSTGGGATPRWRRDGKELFYLASDSQLMSTEVNGKGVAFEIGAVRPLFRTRAAAPALTYDVTADGQRFLVINSVEEEESSPLTLVVNWTAGVKR
jgi:eukaryotic-like serine/threonine-protein kinase